MERIVFFRCLVILEGLSQNIDANSSSSMIQISCDHFVDLFHMMF